MATQRHAGYRQRGFWGRILVTLGSIALVADTSFLAVPLERLFERFRNGLFGIVPAVGLSFLNAAQAIAFHQIDYFSLISRILVLFSAMVALIVGMALLRSQSVRGTAAGHLDTTGFDEREVNDGSSR